MALEYLLDLERFSAEEICKALRISRATFYRHRQQILEGREPAPELREAHSSDPDEDDYWGD